MGCSALHDPFREPSRTTADGDDQPSREPDLGVTLAEAVVGRTWLCAPYGQPSRTVVDELLARSAARPSAIWEVEGLTTIGQLVARGVGVALLPMLALRDLPSNIATVPLRPARHRKLLAATRLGTQRHPVVAACLRAVRAAAGSGDQA